MVSLALDVLSIVLIRLNNHILPSLGNLKNCWALEEAVSGYQLLIFWQNNGNNIMISRRFAWKAANKASFRL
jgi:hypothetical protein